MMGQPQRLSKVLAAAGVASRRHSEELIFAGRVRVNGQIVDLPQHPVTEGVDQIEVDGVQVGRAERKVYYLLNKPAGYLCANAPLGRHERLVIDLFDVEERVFTVGRLDVDTTGLLIVTNDGHFSNSVIHPSANIEKEYVAEVDIDVLSKHMQAILEGMWLEGDFVAPVSAMLVKRKTVQVVVKEGKKREVRYLLENAGLRVRSLSRTRIGGLRLGHLATGTWRNLSPADRERIFSKV